MTPKRVDELRQRHKDGTVLVTVLVEALDAVSALHEELDHAHHTIGIWVEKAAHGVIRETKLMGDLLKEVHLANERDTRLTGAEESKLRQERDDAEEESKKLKDFVSDIRDGYDCDTGANGVHAYHCRCCTAEKLLGLPPHPARDQRTMGG